MSKKNDFLQLQNDPSLANLTASLNQRLNPLVPKLTLKESCELLEIRQEQLIATHRLELSTKPLESLTEGLSFSPHLIKGDLLSIVGNCLEIFYWLRHESPRSHTDDDLIDLIIKVFNQMGGSLEGTRNYLENTLSFEQEPLTLKETNHDQ
ncbi:DUF6323 family protein [uncultured Vagococcus sp.]|uniref:DUF6323 family protein n=1 Tax=uncultured Vagococcus sp. TaxID=189676 RepID=UPI0028D65456|nr:DUF6323 family protein [uncultured Vagococcus sp.]